MVPGADDALTLAVQRQVLKGVEEASLLLFVVDGRQGRTPHDQALARLLRRSGRPILLAVNKVDGDGQEGHVSEFFALGFDPPFPISAEQGRGVATLLDQIVAELPEAPSIPLPAERSRRVRLAVVGRPNVGKSTLFNRLAGHERSVVDRDPGTTRDPVDMEFTHAGRLYQLVDTAGVRRKARAEGEEVEMESVSHTLAVMKGADIVLVVLDATEPATHQDRAVLGEALKTKRPVLVVLNKIDCLDRSGDRSSLYDEIRSRLHFSPDIPMAPVSALRGEGLASLLELLEGLAGECSKEFPTSVLNAALEEAVRRRAPSGKPKPPRFYYVTQTGTYPPSFLVFSNGVSVDPAYRRFLVRHLKGKLGLQWAPIALKFRRRS
jgi:GTP-binding protein